MARMKEHDGRRYQFSDAKVEEAATTRSLAIEEEEGNAPDFLIMTNFKPFGFMFHPETLFGQISVLPPSTARIIAK